MPPTGLQRPDALFDAYFFDLDGTIYLGDDLLPGVSDLIATLRRRGATVRFLSNNPTRTPAMYVDKLTRLGLDVAEPDVVNTVVTTTHWLTQHYPDAVVFPIAEAPLVDALHAAKIATSDDPERIDIVLASYDRSFDYTKLQVAFDAIWQHGRAILVQTNPDRFCPFPGGRGQPDCAAITAAIEACTGVRCQASFGKPSPLMLAAAMHGLDVPLERAIMVGDRLHTDIRMATDAGMPSALVLTGESTLTDVAALPAEHRPTFVVERLDHLLPA